MKRYISLIKPGIIFGNGVSVVGGYFLGAPGNFHIDVFLSALLGISLVIAGGATFNNVIDRDIDRLMERTKTRPLAQETILVPVALLIGSILSTLGLLLLLVGTNAMAAGIAMCGLVLYVIVYSLWLKRTSVHGTLAGSLSGAVPPVVGYVAATGVIDLASGLLVLILCAWQMPHSFAIAIYRASDFRSAKLPLLPLTKSLSYAKRQMLYYGVLFCAASLSLTYYGYTGSIYAVIMALVGGLWVALILAGLRTKQNEVWARRVFLASIAVVTILAVMMSVDAQSTYL